MHPPGLADTLAAALSARVGDNHTAWEMFARLAGFWTGTLDELLDTVESATR